MITADGCYPVATFGRDKAKVSNFPLQYFKGPFHLLTKLHSSTLLQWWVKSIKEAVAVRGGCTLIRQGWMELS